MSLEEKIESLNHFVIDLNTRLLKVEVTLEELKSDFRLTDRCNEERYVNILSRLRVLEKKMETK